MQVLIDNVEYIPDNRTVQHGVMAALEVRFDSDAGDNLSVRDYLYELLKTLWYQGEGFSGKRPFGNSGWEYDLYAPLIKAGFIKGELDEDGYVMDFDEKQAAEFGFELIKACFYGSK